MLAEQLSSCSPLGSEGSEESWLEEQLNVVTELGTAASDVNLLLEQSTLFSAVQPL